MHIECKQFRYICIIHIQANTQDFSQGGGKTFRRPPPFGGLRSPLEIFLKIALKKVDSPGNSSAKVKS